LSPNNSKTRKHFSSSSSSWEPVGEPYQSALFSPPRRYNDTPFNHLKISKRFRNRRHTSPSIHLPLLKYCRYCSSRGSVCSTASLLNLLAFPFPKLFAMRRLESHGAHRQGSRLGQCGERRSNLLNQLKAMFEESRTGETGQVCAADRGKAARLSNLQLGLPS